MGDLLHNLRAALDLMACDLVRLNGLNANGVHFPFSETPKDLPEMIKRRKFFRAGPEAVELLKKMRPYRGGQEALRAIHDLDIQDKHKELIPQFLSFVGPMIKMERVQGQREVKLTVLRDTLNKTEVKVVFPPGSVLEGKELVPTLHDLVELTVIIVESFKGLAGVQEALAQIAGAQVNSTAAG